MFKGNTERHRQLMAELRALEAQEAGITAATVVTPPKDKLSLGKAVMFLAGLGAVGWYLVFSNESPFEESLDAAKVKSSKPGNEAHEILNQIKYGQMDSEESVSVRKPLTTEPQKPSVFDILAQRASLGGPK